MTTSTDVDLLGVLSATWPAAETRTLETLILRRSSGGGQRVTAARPVDGRTPTEVDVEAAETQMIEWKQPCLYQVGPEDETFDKTLAARGFALVDPTILYSCPLDALLEIETPRLSTFVTWPILAIQAEIWAEGGIGPDRLAVMQRVSGPRTALLGRSGDRPAATGFVACHETVAMVHALEVRPEFRREGVARRMMGRAAQWARDQQATHMALAVTEANAAARALYSSLGMEPVGRYHYRKRVPEPT